MTDVQRMLEAFAESYRAKAPENLSLTVQITVQPRNETWHVVVEPGRQVRVVPGEAPAPTFRCVTTAEVLEDLCEGRMSGLTAAGKARASDPAPLEVVPGPGVSMTPGLAALLFSFGQHFFNRSLPERIPLGVEHARVIHGGHAIPLYYHPGFRSAWYSVGKGQQLNEPGDTNPFHQAFVIIAGEGTAKIGDDVVPVKAREAYYIPPGADHVVWTEADEPLELIFLAWGPGA